MFYNNIVHAVPKASMYQDFSTPFALGRTDGSTIIDRLVEGTALSL